MNRYILLKLSRIYENMPIEFAEQFDNTEYGLHGIMVCVTEKRKKRPMMLSILLAPLTDGERETLTGVFGSSRETMPDRLADAIRTYYEQVFGAGAWTDWHKKKLKELKEEAE